MIKNELDLARILREQLTPLFKKVYININLASNRFYPYWKEWHGEPVPSAQPQIDLIIVDTDLHLLGIELKYFRKTLTGQINYPFYAGIGEALALLRFGFWTVSLWHFFDERLEGEDYRRLSSNCELLVNRLQLPVNYQAFRMVEDAVKLKFMRLYSQGAIVEMDDTPSAYGKANPLESGLNAQKIQDILRAVLKIPHHR